MGSEVALIAAAAQRLRAGDAAGAERLFRSVLARAPGNIPAIRGLGGILLDSEREAEACGVIGPAAQLRPADIDLQTLWGRCLYAAGRLDEARQVLGRALRKSPGSTGARLWLARCLTGAQRPTEALALLRPLLDSAPGDALLQTVAGQVYMGLTDERAIGHFRAAAGLSPTAERRADLGWSLEMVGRREEALTEFEAALAAKPGLATAAAGKLAVLVARGSKEEARAFAEEALARGVLDPSLAITYARLSRNSEGLRKARGVLERALEQHPGATWDRSRLLLALGLVLEESGDYDGAFARYREGNEVTRAPFDLPAYERAVGEYIEVFSRGAQALRPRASRADPLPVFIVGMPRSGTSLVEQILSSHPRVHGGGELEDLTRLAADIPGRLGKAGPRGFPASAAGLGQEEVERLAAGHLAALRSMGGGAARVTDKMPQNYVFLGLIDLLFPGARVIHCARDPLDTCFSCYTTALSGRHTYRSRLSDLAGVYRTYRGLMAHWRGVVRVPILDVRYEDLVADPERVTRELVSFVGLEWDPACLRFHENARPVLTASADQVRRPMYASSVGRWRRFERHLGELIGGLDGL